MDRASMQEKYASYDAQRAKELVICTRRSNRLGNIKLIVFVLLLSLVMYAFMDGLQLWSGAALFAVLAAFVALCIVHAKARETCAYIEGVRAVIGKYRARIEGEWSAFGDSGAEYMDAEHPYASDLDIVGKKSLFQLLNVSGTHEGRKRFVQDLCAAAYTADELSRRQEAIGELSGLDAFSFDFQYHAGKIVERGAISDIAQSLQQEKPFIKSAALKAVLRYAPLAVLAFVGAVYIFAWRVLYIPAAVLALAQLVTWLLTLMATNRRLAFVGKAKYALGQYAELFALVEKQGFQSEKLKALKQTLASGEHSASKALRALDGIMQRIALRNNAIVYALANILSLWDLRVAIRLADWQAAYAPQLNGWFEALGELESLLSFSVFNCVVENAVFPEIAAERGIFEAAQVGHPLLKNAERVYNDFTLHGGIVMISGSNMSGKSTFLRTVGINAVLARAGAAVCAERLRVSIMRPCTSMRIADDLKEGVSTFYAELKRVRTILDAVEQDDNALFLIDEIFRGTNSHDRALGAKRVVRKLFKSHACGFLTTHDLSLCAFEDDTQVGNWSFSERYDEGKIVFDYKIAPGIAKTTNAQYLMRMVGILD